MDLSDELYYLVKRDALETRTTMSVIVRKMLEDKYGDKHEKNVF